MTPLTVKCIYIPEDRADRIISTAHKAKGREWESVLIADDFTPSDERQASGISRDEQMLAYVAVTRAMRHLDPSGLSWALEAV
jgi:superfamily I DNA/RNA helicase